MLSADVWLSVVDDYFQILNSVIIFDVAGLN